MSEQPHRGEPRVGSLGEEAAKLFGALSDWAGEHAADGEPVGDDSGTAAGPECTFCPICRTVHAVRHASPEVRAQVVGAAQHLLQAVSGLLAAAAQLQAQSQSERSRSTVQHIDLDDEGLDDQPDEESP